MSLPLSKVSSLGAAFGLVVSHDCPLDTFVILPITPISENVSPSVTCSAFVSGARSRPSRARGSKLRKVNKQDYNGAVASFAGAWIETSLSEKHARALAERLLRG